MSSLPLDGVIVVDKPQGWTSHDVVGKMRRIAGTKRVGHLGTLDPLATGVLPLVLNKATRLAQFYTKNEKSYRAVVRFGFSTDSYDADGKATSEEVAFEATEEGVRPLLGPFRGEFQQTPPPISAKKIGGTPAYKLARKNLAVELKAVAVTVTRIELISVEGAEATIAIDCSAGTYVRSIAHEMGVAAGCGAHLSALRRLQSGDFGVEQSRTLPELESLAAEGRLGEAMLPAAELLPDFPLEIVDPTTAGQIRQGRDFRVSPFHGAKGARYVKALTGAGELIAIGEARLPHLYHPVLVL
ncbi:MAG: tRNA pseudouridine(55) synthase TruB [Bryobacteraceae bacterium]